MTSRRFAIVEVEHSTKRPEQDGEWFDILVQPQRDKRAAKRFLRKLFKALNLKFKSKGPDEPGICG